MHLKKQEPAQKRIAEVEFELGRVLVRVFGDMAPSLQPKERISSISFLSLAARTCTVLSYRKAAKMLNLFFHRDSRDSIKLRMFSNMVERAGGRISSTLTAVTENAWF